MSKRALDGVADVRSRPDLLALLVDAAGDGCARRRDTTGRDLMLHTVGNRVLLGGTPARSQRVATATRWSDRAERIPGEGRDFNQAARRHTACYRVLQRELHA
jgi:hypothetical protein